MDKGEQPICRVCRQPVSGEAALDPDKPAAAVQSYLHPDCAKRERDRIALVTAARRRRVEAGAEQLLRAAKRVLAGLEARVEKARAAGAPLPVFDGMAGLHAAVARAEGDRP